MIAVFSTLYLLVGIFGFAAGFHGQNSWWIGLGFTWIVSGIIFRLGELGQERNLLLGPKYEPEKPEERHEKIPIPSRGVSRLVA